MATRVFLSGVASRAHLLYAAGYVRHVLASGERVQLVDLGVRRFLGRANVTAEDVRALLPQHDELVHSPLVHRWRGLPGDRLVYVAIGAPGVKPLLRLRLANPRRHVHVVVVDEGLGSYGTWGTRRDAWVREGHPWWRATVRALVVHAARRWLTDERWSLYRPAPQGWVVDDLASSALRCEVAPPPRRPPYAVLLAQPWCELGLTTRDEQQREVAAVAAACDLLGLVLLVRPHPAQSVVELPRNVALADGKAPAELDPVVRGATVVLGGASTGLLNVAALGLAPCQRLDLAPARAAEAALAPAQRSLLSAFLGEGVHVGELANTLADRWLSRPVA